MEKENAREKNNLKCFVLVDRPEVETPWGKSMVNTR